MILKVKNNTAGAKTWCGMEIASGAYYEPEESEISRWQVDDAVLTSIGAGELVINNGTSDITGVNNQINYLKGNTPINADGVPIFVQELVNTDKRPIVHATMRRIGTYTYVSSSGDDPDDPADVGGGVLIELDHKDTDDTDQCAYFDMNCVLNETHIQGAYAQWYGAKRDTFQFQICCQSSADAIGTGTNTYYEVMYGTLIMVPGVGTKTVTNWDLIKPVEMVANEFGEIPAGYWDADYNTSTHKFENYTFRADGSGRYNIFATEIMFQKFIPEFLMLGNDHFDCHPSDCSQVGHGMRFKVVWKTRGTNHNWEFCAAIKFFRKHTV